MVLPDEKCSRCGITDTPIDPRSDSCLWCVIKDLEEEILDWKTRTFTARMKLAYLCNQIDLLKVNLGKEFEGLDDEE